MEDKYKYVVSVMQTIEYLTNFSKRLGAEEKTTLKMYIGFLSSDLDIYFGPEKREYLKNVDKKTN